MADTEPKPRVRMAPRILACVALAVLAASLLLRPSSRRERGPSRRSTAPAAAPSIEDGAATGPVAAKRTADGAKVAAIAYLRLSERVVGMDDAAAADAQRAVATSSAADGLVTETLAKLAVLRRAYPGAPVILRVAPLAIRVTVDGPDRATTEIWHVDVVSPPGGTAYEQWRTTRYELAWERDAWRVASETALDGPRPLSAALPAPVTANALEAALAGFQAAQ